jgi:hypothetical protein
LKCNLLYILDPESKKCFSCADDSRPAQLITNECPELYKLSFFEQVILDDFLWIQIVIDRETLCTKQNIGTGDYIDFSKMDWMKTI